MKKRLIATTVSALVAATVCVAGCGGGGNGGNGDDNSNGGSGSGSSGSGSNKTDFEGGNAKTGDYTIASVAGIAAIAGAALVLTKKKNDDK